MIIAKIDGGLGNQMFKYATGLHLSWLHDTDLKLDISWFDNVGLNEAVRTYDLGVFNIQESFASEEDIARALKKKLIFFQPTRIVEKNFRWAREHNKDMYLDAPFQSDKFFKESKGLIQKHFTLKEEYASFASEMKKKIQGSNSVSLHIRRTDYVTTRKNKYHQCDIDYYRKGIEYVAKRRGPIELFAFSDDIEWVKENLKTEFPIHFMEGNKAYEDLILMSMCKDNIMANSSFSWWASWLNNNPEKIVMTPRYWFIDQTRNTANRVPVEWVKV